MSDPPAVNQRPLWYIHGQAYDLAPMTKWHPGGADILQGCEGRDCTEVFESSHALSDKNITAMMARYLVKDAPALSTPAVPFTFKDDGVYAELKSRVKAHFAARGGNYKANWFYWAKFGPLFGLYVVLMYAAFIRGSLLAAAGSGSVWMLMLFYGILHDASHSSLSKSATVNKVWSVISSHWGLWHHEIWLQHHVYGHHSYTGVPTHDPDLAQWPEIWRKHSAIEWNSAHKVQNWTYFILLLFFPNQYWGQVFAYWKTRITRTPLFHLPIILRTRPSDIIPWSIEALSVLFHGVLPAYLFGLGWAAALNVAHWTMSGIFYFLIVAPNHDSDANDKVSTEVGDWGEHQIRHSCNFALKDKVLTNFFGGMNFQIEHHLFPTMCNMHYPSISPIVQAVCKERGIPYPCHPTLFAAHRSVWRAMIALGKKPNSILH